MARGIRIKRPYDEHIDRAIEDGKTDFRAAPDGLYLRRIADELEGSIDVERMGPGVFRATRTETPLKKVFEGERYAFYQKEKKKWKDLI